MQTIKEARGRKKPKAAATSDVLGPVARPERISGKWRKHYDHLIELREHLLSHQSSLSRDALEEQPTFSSHMADAATDTYDRDFALGMLSSRQDAVYEIDEAIERIRDGSYGICELTGKPIEERRLEAIPWTRFTAEAEQKLEKEGEVKTARLGPRDTVAKSEPKSEEEEDDS